MADTNNVVPDPVVQEQYEEGLPLPEPAERKDGKPVGGGRWALPHYTTFSAIQNIVSRGYRYTHDEALRHSHTNAIALRNDLTIFEALRAVMEPVAQLPWHLECENEEDSEQANELEKLTKIVKQTPNLQRLIMHALEAIFYGRYGVQMVYEWDWSSGDKRLVVRDFRPINGDKIIFRWSGEAGILVHTAYKGPYVLTDRGRAHILTPSEREQIIIHKHEPEDADFYEGQMAGAIHGVGLRSRLYWFWWLKNQVLAWMLDYLERVGAGGLTIYYYEAGNQASLTDVKAAAEEQWRNNAILFPRFKDQSKDSGPGIQRVEASQAGAQMLLELNSKYFDRCIRRAILGENSSADEAPSGIGDGKADFDAASLGRKIKYHAVNLQETLNSDFIPVMARYNTPKLRNPRWVFDVDKPNVKELLEAAKALYEMGGQIDEDHLRGIIGLPKPEQGSSVLAMAPPMSPVAVGAQPMGVPQMGAPGPDPSGGAGQPPPQQIPPQPQ